MPLTADDDIRGLLTETRTVAMIGASDRPDRPSYGVMRAMQDHGYRVLPVNSTIAGQHVHGEFVWARLDQIGLPIEWSTSFAVRIVRARRWTRRSRWVRSPSGCRSA